MVDTSDIVVASGFDSNRLLTVCSYGRTFIRFVLGRNGRKWLVELAQTVVCDSEFMI